MPTPETSTLTSDAATKTCPYCAEVIRAAAIKCRYCQSDLTEPAPRPTPTPTTAPARVRVRAPERAAARPARPSSRPVGRSGRWAVRVAPLVALALVALGALEWRDASRLEEARQARTTAQAAVTERVEALLSYDHRTFDEDLAAAQEVMTSSFQEEYAPTVESIRERALDQKRSQSATVVGASALPGDDPDRVELLLFVDTVSTQQGSKEQRVLQNRVKVTLVRDGGSWLVDDLTVPQG